MNGFGAGAGLCIAPASRVGPVPSLDRLRDLHSEGIAAVLISDAVDADLREDLTAQPIEALPQLRITCRASQVTQAIHAAAKPTLPDEVSERLAQVAGAMARQAAEAMGCLWVRMRLDVVEGDACRRFHLDNVSARLICAICGRGTQYGVAAAEGSVDRIEEAATGAALFLRGALFPSGEASGLLHRSPSIEGTGETRYVLVIDPVFDMEVGI